MKVSIDWIKDFVDIPETDPVKLGEEFTLHTCEVEDVAVSGEVLAQVYVARITSVEPHPDADKLRICAFDAGTKGSGKVVCGAPNAATGLLVPYAPVGTTLPIGFTLEPKKIRGVMSEGMLCAEDELGLSEDHEGLMVLPDDAVPGTPLSEYLGMKPTVVFDIDNKSITHRPDLWGHFGMAREFGAVFVNPLKNPFDSRWEEKLEALFTADKAPVEVKVEPDSCCLGYFGYTVSGITVDASPTWMQKRLIDCGLRPINSIVDISNYVMLELGIPNHIFDKEKIEKGLIHVRRVGREEEFTTLDEMPRQLIPEDTVVADGVKPLVIAGIMGGSNSGVSDDTREVFVEVANWKDVEIRKTSTRIGLRTDSSLRYEKTLDTLSLKRSALRILELLLELNPGAAVKGGLQYDGIDLSSIKPVSIRLAHSRIESILGASIPEERVVEILKALDYTVQHDTGSGEYTVGVPSVRATKDVECDADIIEDIGRIFGYSNLTPEAPVWPVDAVSLHVDKKLHRRIQDFMVLHADAQEIMTYPLTGEATLAKAEWHDMAEKLTLANALSPEYSRMRPSIIPEFLESAALNSRNYDSYTMFEIGRVYLAHEKEFSVERNHLIAGFFDRSASRYIDAVNTAEKLLRFINVPAVIQAPESGEDNPCIPRNWSGNHPYEIRDIRVMGKPMGSIVTVHPLLCRSYKLKGYLTLMLLDLHDFESKELKDKTSYKPLPRFPVSVFDFSVVADANCEAALIVEAAKSYRCRELRDVRVADVFSLEDGKKSVTLRARFLDEEKTLTGEFLDRAQKELIQAVESAGFPLKS